MNASPASLLHYKPITIGKNLSLCALNDPFQFRKCVVLFNVVVNHVRYYIRIASKQLKKMKFD